jgi:hypothetical protein
MKKMILSVFALTAVGTFTYAQSASSAPAAATEQAQVAPAAEQKETKKQVEASALPAPIQKLLTTDQYKDWKLVTAWQINGASEYYVLEMQKGDEKNALKLDKEAKVL